MEYKEKLRLAKEALDSGSYDKETIEYIFPELAESEEERTRKELLNAFKEATDSLYMVLTPLKREAFIAWLEKQGEKEKFIKKELECIKGYREKAIKRLEELEKQGEQKSSWSEEDEEHLNSIISDIKADMGAYPRSQEVIDIYNDEISFLKSLKDRYTWRPSEEQMEALLYEVNAWDEDSVNGQNLKSLYQDLKKLKN